MNNYFFYIVNKLCLHAAVVCILFLLCFETVDAQQLNDSFSSSEILIRPRVGVVLSGGGAKGFAHIGALKVIEEAGIPIDYISGTSMGSVIGGLYAAGYDPDSLIMLIKQQNWDNLMADIIPRKYIPIDEKIMDRHYLATFPFKNKKIQLKSALYEGEMISLLLARLTTPVYRIRDYSKLSIPFICVATDMENANAYEMNEGILYRSIRASMSIPFFFTPVEIDGRLLVDGGVRNNFPVQNLLDKDLDIIIGVDVQRGFYKKEELNSSARILNQIISMTDIDINEKALKNVDYYIHPDVKNFSIMDFNSFDSIIAAGEKAARDVFPQLKHLADSINAIQTYKRKRPHIMPLDTVYVVGIKINGVDPKNAKYIRKSFAKYYPIYMSINDIETAIMKIYGTGYYDDIWYDLYPEESGAILILHCNEKEEGSAAITAHYDSDLGIGVLVNLSLKNAINYAKRTTVTLDLNIAENPYIKLYYYTNAMQKFKYGAELSAVNLFMNQYENKNIINTYSIQDDRLDIFSEYMPSLEQQLRFGVVFNYSHLRDKLKSIMSSDEYDFFGFAYLKYYLNNEDSPTFASRGWKLNILGKYILPRVKLEDGSMMKSSLVVRGDLDVSIAIEKNNSLKLGLCVGSSIGNVEPPINYQFFIGGQSNMKYFDNFINFEGLKFTQLYGDNMVLGKASWQYNFYKNFYAIATCNCGYISKNYNEWFSGENFIIGYGLTFGVKTLAGPIEVSLMGSNKNSEPNGFINVGYWF